MRKLASIKKIDNILPIKDADAIECAVLGGWKVVVKKNEFSIGDNVVYFEIDSFLPMEDKYEFLRASSYRKMGEEEGFRLRTVRLRGQISQGLILPISLYGGIVDFNCEVGTDLTELLNIQKWEPPIPACLAGDVLGVYPTFLFPKTDEERIQNLSDYFELYCNDDFEESEKIDGASMTVFHCSYADEEKYQFGVCSRNLQMKETEGNTLWKVARKYRLIEQLSEHKLNFAIQGELYGEGIQGNPEKIRGQDFLVYKIFNIDTQEFLDEDTRASICELLKLKTVPILNKSIKIFQVCKTMESILERASGPSSLNPNTKREGLVFKKGNISFKVISNEYLLKHGDR